MDTLTARAAVQLNASKIRHHKLILFWFSIQRGLKNIIRLRYRIDTNASFSGNGTS